MELLSAPYFEMYNNVSTKIAIRLCKDMTNRIKNRIVLVEEFMFEDNILTEKYDKLTHNTIIHEIRLACHFG